MPPIAALRAFEAAARTGSLTRAAAELNVTHSAIAQQVRKLEAWLETPLMQRKGRGVEVIPTANQFAKDLSAGFDQIKAAVRRQEANRLTAPLRLATTPAFAETWLLPRLHSFCATHPDIGFAIEPSVELVDLTQGVFDVSFRYGEGPWDGLESTFVVASHMVLVAAKSMENALGDRSPAALARAPWVQETNSSEVSDWLDAHGIEDFPRQVTDIPAQYSLSAILSGRGIGWATTMWIEEELASGDLILLEEAEDGPTTGYHLCHLPAPHRPYLKAFLDWAQEQIRLDPPRVKDAP